MDTLAILVPTYGRADRLAAVAKNIHDHTRVTHTIYFLCEQSDPASFKEVDRLHEQSLVLSSNSYVAAVNAGYRSTQEPFIFCASDDVEFSDDWDTRMLACFDDPKIGFVGATDEWTISKTGKHASHFMVRRTYIQKQSGVFDEQNVIYSSAYIHSMCDIETEQTAMSRGAFLMSDVFISHKHWFMKTAQMDKTYQRAINAGAHDMAAFNARRKKFELYKFEDLFNGIITSIAKGGLTVVIPSLNELSFLKQTVQSLQDNTYNEYELIIIDDGSDEVTQRYIKTLPCVKVFNGRQRYVNANWNLGIAMAKNEYVCIANNDITFSKHWDLPLIEELRKDDVWVASPYQTDPNCMQPYGLSDRSGNIDLRGACFMINKQMIQTIGFIPKDMLIWFGDYWLTVKAKEFKKKCVFNSKSVIHHYSSRSSESMIREKKDLFYQILRGDAYAFKCLTGINADHWLKIIYDRLDLPSPV